MKLSGYNYYVENTLCAYSPEACIYTSFTGQCYNHWPPAVQQTRKLQVHTTFAWSSADTCLPEVRQSPQQGWLVHSTVSFPVHFLLLAVLKWYNEGRALAKTQKMGKWCALSRMLVLP